MRSPSCPPASPLTLKVLCVRMCLFYSSVCLMGTEAARLRCGTDLLSDLIFVCGDRGIYLGKGTWSGYGARPRRKGIVDQCCRPTGCELQHLEMYCAKAKSEQPTTADPATTTATAPTTAPTTTTATATASTTAPQTTTQPDVTQQQFQALFQKRLSEHLGAPDSPKREAYRKKTQPSPRRKGKVSSSRRRIKAKNPTSRPPPTSTRPLQRTLRSQS